MTALDDTLSTNNMREGIVERLSEFREYITAEFVSEIDCSLLVSSFEYEECFENMYSLVDKCCTEEINQRLRSLVYRFQSEPTVSVDEIEGELIRICNQISKLTYRSGSKYDNGIYEELVVEDLPHVAPKQSAPHTLHKECGDSEDRDEDDEDDEADEADEAENNALVSYVKVKTQEMGLSWYENNMIESISSNYALNVYNACPLTHQHIPVESVIDTKTFYAVFDPDECKQLLQETYTFSEDSEIEKYRLLLFISIRTEGGSRYNMLSLLSWSDDTDPDNPHTQNLSLRFIDVDAKALEMFLATIEYNAERFDALPPVDSDDAESLRLNILKYRTFVSFFEFYRSVAQKCDAEEADELKEHIDKVLDKVKNALSGYQLKSICLLVDNLSKTLEDILPKEDPAIIRKKERCSQSDVLSIDIKQPEYMNFRTGESGFTVYLTLNLLTDAPVKMRLHDIFIFFDGRQWASSYNYEGYAFTEDFLYPNSPKTIGKIWINDSWKRKEIVPEESYLTISLKDSDDKLYFFKYIFGENEWLFDDYYVVENSK